ncbi:MAG: methyltransferase family protein [Candidatus Nanoarchaeia archaeon]
MDIIKILKATTGAIFAAMIFFVLLPYLFIRAGSSMGLETSPNLAGALMGGLFILAGLCIFFYCFYLFVKEGKGTPAPFEPARCLVSGNLYQYSRNPMYIGYLSIIIGEVFLIGSLPLLVYAIIIAIFIYLYVIYYEEPRLEEKFGEAYIDYKRRVPRWV